MASYSQRIQNANDDAGKSSGSWSTTSGNIPVGRSFGGSDYISAIRYNNVTIPQGDTINSATLTFNSISTISKSRYVKVYGFAEDNTSDLSTDASARPRTTTAIDWDEPPVGFQEDRTVDVTAIVQEIIDRTGWVSGNNLGFIIVNDGSANDEAHFYYAYDGVPSRTPLLQISSSNVSPSASISPSSSISRSASLSISPSSSLSSSPSPSPGNDFGIKIAKPGCDVYSTDINDYILWTKYPPITFLEKKTTTITVGSGGCSGTLSVPHDYDFFLLTKVTVEQQGSGNRYFMPATDFGTISCGVGDIPNINFTYKVYEDRIDIEYNAECIEPMVGTSCPLSNATFDIELYFYMWELGSPWPQET